MLALLCGYAAARAPAQPADPGPDHRRPRALRAGERGVPGGAGHRLHAAAVRRRRADDRRSVGRDRARRRDRGGVLRARAQRVERRYRPAFFAQMQLRALVAVGDVLVAGARNGSAGGDRGATSIGTWPSCAPSAGGSTRWCWRRCSCVRCSSCCRRCREIEADARRRFLERRFKTPPLVAAVPQAPHAGHDPDLPAAELRRLLRRSEVVRVDRLPAVQPARPGCGSGRARAGPAPADGRPARGHRRQGARDRHLHHRQRRRRRRSSPTSWPSSTRTARSWCSSAAGTSSRATSPRTRSA